MENVEQSKHASNYRKLAQSLKIETRAYIDGTYTEGASFNHFECMSPIDGTLVARVTRCDARDVERSVGAGRRAFKSGVWSSMGLAVRKATMLRFASIIEENLTELAILETMDTGKPIKDTVGFDIPSTVKTIRWYAESIDKLYGEVAPTDTNVLGLVTREPIGVVGCIVPWNFPAYMAAVKFAPALASGNSVILKPAEQSPLTAIKLAQYAGEAGIPPGVFNVLPGFGDEVGEPIALHMDVDAVAFTGSTEVAKLLLQAAGRSNMKRIQLEAGGKSAHIVLSDTRNLDEAAAAVVDNIFFNSGQICDAGARLIVENSIKDKLLSKILALTAKLNIGDPFDPAVDFGAIIDNTQLDRIQTYVSAGVEEGARVLCGGTTVQPVQNGYYFEPTIFDLVDNSMSIAQEEIFGPVLSVLTCRSLDEAIAIANDSCFGLAAGIWTSDFDKALKAAKKLRSGSVFINNYSGSDLTVPFGGYKQSGSGRDKSLRAFEHYTELKTTWAVALPF